MTKLTVRYEDREHRRFDTVVLVTGKDETPQDACKRFSTDGFTVDGDDLDHLKYYPGSSIMNITWEK